MERPFIAAPRVGLARSTPLADRDNVCQLFPTRDVDLIDELTFPRLEQRIAVRILHRQKYARGMLSAFLMGLVMWGVIGGCLVLLASGSL